MTRQRNAGHPTTAHAPRSRRAARCGLHASLFVLAWLGAGCADGKAWQGPPPQADLADFEATAYPVLLRDCAFPQCHGGEQRFFQVFGPGRVRLDPELEPTDPATPAEVARSFERALSMLQTDDRLNRTLLLNKPLEPSAGGQGHEGLDALGRDVYATPFDPDHAVLQHWAYRALGNRLGSTP